MFFMKCTLTKFLLNIILSTRLLKNNYLQTFDRFLQISNHLQFHYLMDVFKNPMR